MASKKQISRKVQGHIGIGFNDEGICISHVITSKASHDLQICQFVHCEKEKERHLKLRSTVQDLDLEGAGCVYILSIAPFE